MQIAGVSIYKDNFQLDRFFAFLQYNSYKNSDV